MIAALLHHVVMWGVPAVHHAGTSWAGYWTHRPPSPCGHFCPLGGAR